MLIFARERLVFLSVPKTGTTAFAQALAPRASLVVAAPPELKHAPVFRYNRFFRQMVERFVGPDVAILAVMREPVDWLGSWYRYRGRADLRGHPNGTQGMSFDEFVQAYCRREPPDFARVGSQAKFLEPQRNGVRVTHLFRYEDQAGLRAFLEDRLGVAIAPPRTNRSPERALALGPATRALLARRCAADFALHDAIGPGGAYRMPGSG
ncbi:MAG: gamma-glutamyl kinase [Roseovarius sp.]|nr:gamma-glutamyl kinase [Roseovarius sp.]MBK45314.1 gamma-glutamyl kinase [Roseovarius sp.]